jgi:hypothetical protein
MTDPNDVILDLKATAVSLVCDLVSQFEETMPDGLWRLLERAPRSSHEDQPNDRSYRSAAEYLSRLIKERKAHFERLDRADQ